MGARDPVASNVRFCVQRPAPNVLLAKPRPNGLRLQKTHASNARLTRTTTVQTAHVTHVQQTQVRQPRARCRQPASAMLVLRDQTASPVPRARPGRTKQYRVLHRASRAQRACSRCWLQQQIARRVIRALRTLITTVGIRRACLSTRSCACADCALWRWCVHHLTRTTTSTVTRSFYGYA